MGLIISVHPCEEPCRERRPAGGGRISVGWAGVRRYIRQQNWSQDRPLQGQEGAIPTGLGQLERAPARQTFDSRQ